jgi:hypothetical protein
VILTGIRILYDEANHLAVLGPKRRKTFIIRNGECIEDILMVRRVSETAVSTPNNNRHDSYRGFSPGGVIFPFYNNKDYTLL